MLTLHIATAGAKKTSLRRSRLRSPSPLLVDHHRRVPGPRSQAFAGRRYPLPRREITGGQQREVAQGLRLPDSLDLLPWDTAGDEQIVNGGVDGNSEASRAAYKRLIQLRPWSRDSAAAPSSEIAARRRARIRVQAPNLVVDLCDLQIPAARLDQVLLHA